MTIRWRSSILASVLVTILFLPFFSPIFSVQAWEGDGEGVIEVDVHEALRIGFDAIDALEKGVLEGAKIVDDNTLEIPLEALKMAIQFLPTAAKTKELALKIGDEIGKRMVGDVLEETIEGAAKVNSHYKSFSEGFFSSNMSMWKERLVSLDSRFRKYDDEYLWDIDFIEDMRRYHLFLEDVGEKYPGELMEIVEAHDWEERKYDMIFLGVAIVAIIITWGAATPFVIAVKAAYRTIETIGDLREDFEFYESLCFTSENQMIDALYYASQVSKGLEYAANKLESDSQYFPKISIIPVGDGSVWAINEYNEPLNVKVVYNSSLASIPHEEHKASETHAYSVPSEEIALQPDVPTFFVKPPPPSDVTSWIEQQASNGNNIKEMVDLNIFYGENGLHAMKKYTMNFEYKPYIEEDQVKEDYEMTEGGVGALVSIKTEEQKTETDVEVKLPDISIETEAEVDRVTVEVSSIKETGRTIAVVIDSDTLPVSEIQEVLVLCDGKEISLASSYTDVLNPNDEDVPEYLVIMFSGGIQVFVSIPQFSTHTITIMRVKPPSPFPQELFIVIFAFAVIFVAIVGTAVLLERKHPTRFL